MPGSTERSFPTSHYCECSHRRASGRPQAVAFTCSLNHGWTPSCARLPVFLRQSESGKTYSLAACRPSSTPAQASFLANSRRRIQERIPILQACWGGGRMSRRPAKPSGGPPHWRPSVAPDTAAEEWSVTTECSAAAHTSQKIISQGLRPRVQAGLPCRLPIFEMSSALE